MTNDVKTSQSTTPLIQICQIMENNNIGSVIVVNESQSPIGIITERDVVSNIAKEEATLLLQAQDVMSTPLFAIKDQDSLIDALQVMNTHHFRRLPIITMNKN